MELIHLQIKKNYFDSKKEHGNYIIFYILKGKATIHIEDHIFKMQKTDIVVVNPWEKYTIQGEDEIIYIGSIKGAELYEILDGKQKCIVCNTCNEKNENFKELRLLLDRMINAYFNHDNGTLLFQRSCFDVVNNLISEFSNDTFFDPIRCDRKYSIENYIENQYQNNISLEQISDYFGFTPQYFSKLFKEIFGMTFLKYLKTVRLKYAVEDLIHTNYTVLYIALKNGYPNMTSFSNSFNKEFHMSPTQYRQKNKKIEVIKNDIEYNEVKELLSIEEIENEKTQHRIYINSKKNNQILNKYWTNICNLGDISKLSNGDIKEQIHVLQKELNFKFARVNLDTLKLDIKEKKHFLKEQDAIDVLMKENFRIIFSISYSEFGNEKYLLYFEQLLYYIINRYGFANVASWKFELFYDNDFRENRAKQYADFYDGLIQLLENVGIDSNVGGPGLLLDESGENLQRFLKKNLRIKTLSLTIAPYKAAYSDDNLFISRNTDSNYILNQYYLARSITVNYPNIEKIYISNWKDSLYDINMINDSCHRGASIVKNIIQGYNILESLPVDKPLDILVDNTDRTGIFSGLPGLLTKESIKKPSFYAYKLLKNLDQNFIYKDNHVIVTNNEQKYFQIICHNYKKLNYKYYAHENEWTEVENVEEFFIDNKNKKITFVINYVPEGVYILKERSINRNQGSAFDTWRKMNFTSESFFGIDEMLYLKSTTLPFLCSNVLNSKNGVLEFEVELLPNEIKHLHIIYSH